MSSRPARAASSTTYWIAGVSTTGSISFGCAFVAGRHRVPTPAAGITAFVTFKGKPSSASGGSVCRRSRPISARLRWVYGRTHRNDGTQGVALDTSAVGPGVGLRPVAAAGARTLLVAMPTYEYVC